MDLDKTISDLRVQRDKIDAVIQQLEAMRDGVPMKTHSTRGRKSMGDAERREVSARMKRYWASRRKGSR
jgi:hypothetical protein